MSAHPASETGPTRSHALWMVLWIGLVAGTLDVTDNLIFNQFRGVTPTMRRHFSPHSRLKARAGEPLPFALARAWI